MHDEVREQKRQGRSWWSFGDDLDDSSRALAPAVARLDA